MGAARSKEPAFRESKPASVPYWQGPCGKKSWHPHDWSDLQHWTKYGTHRFEHAIELHVAPASGMTTPLELPLLDPLLLPLDPLLPEPLELPLLDPLLLPLDPLLPELLELPLDPLSEPPLLPLLEPLSPPFASGIEASSFASFASFASAASPLAASSAPSSPPVACMSVAPSSPAL
jgi:hypothetical protein